MSEEKAQEITWHDLLLAMIIIAAVALLTMEIMDRYEEQITGLMQRGVERGTKWLDF